LEKLTTNEQKIVTLLEERKTAIPSDDTNDTCLSVSVDGDTSEDRLKTLDDYIEALTRQREVNEEKTFDLINKVKMIRKDTKDVLTSQAEKFVNDNPEIELLLKEIALYSNLTRLNILSTDDNLIQCYLNNKYKDKITYLEVNLNNSDPHTRALIFWQSMLGLFAN
jgi:hypothetical protein